MSVTDREKFSKEQEMDDSIETASSQPKLTTNVSSTPTVPYCDAIVGYGLAFDWRTIKEKWRESLRSNKSVDLETGNDEEEEEGNVKYLIQDWVGEICRENCAMDVDIIVTGGRNEDEHTAKLLILQSDKVIRMSGRVGSFDWQTFDVSHFMASKSDEQMMKDILHCIDMRSQEPKLHSYLCFE